MRFWLYNVSLEDQVEAGIDRGLAGRRRDLKIYEESWGSGEEDGVSK